jgi:hypothetical protein
MGYIYLLQVYPSHNQAIYKVGMTNRNFSERYNEYIASKQSPRIILVLECKNCDIAEKYILSLFNSNFKKCQFGNEYFIGDEYEMKSIVMNHILSIKPDLEKMDIDYQQQIIEKYSVLIYEFIKYLLGHIVEKNIFHESTFSKLFTDWYAKQKVTLTNTVNIYVKLLNTLKEMKIIILETNIITVYDAEIQILLKKYDYVLEESTSQFINEMMQLDFTSSGTSRNDIYDKYKNWCSMKNIGFLSYKKFDEELSKKYQRYKTNCVMFRYLKFN